MMSFAETSVLARTFALRAGEETDDTRWVVVAAEVSPNWNLPQAVCRRLHPTPGEHRGCFMTGGNRLAVP